MTPMKVLMYGWEFPPHISGGLGMACYAIVKELAKKHLQISLVLPETVTPPFNANEFTVIGCNSLLHELTSYDFDKFAGNVAIKSAGITSFLRPYISSRDYAHKPSMQELQEFFDLLAAIDLPDEVKYLALAKYRRAFGKDSEFSGDYGINLLNDVLRYALVAGSLAKNIEHNVIHVHDWLTVLAGVEAKRISRKPLFFHVHALETDRSGKFVDQRIFAIEKYGLEQADQVIAVSNYTKNAIVRYYGIASEKIAVVHNGIYFDEAKFIAKQQNKKNGPPMVLFLGRLTSQKGPDYFVEVAKKVLVKRDDVQFVIAGSGDLLKGLIERVASLRIGKNVHFMGFLGQEDVQKMFQLADVYVMPSVSEPFGLSCLEASANNVPAIISKQSGVAEVMQHVLIVDFWDVDEMAAKILALLKYKTLCNTMLNNVTDDLKRLTWDKTADAIVNIYRQFFVNI
jgi:glycosyltransferase involved in cell wall biosynthesis